MSMNQKSFLIISMNQEKQSLAKERAANSGFAAAARTGKIAAGGMNLEEKVRSGMTITPRCHATTTSPRKAVPMVIQGSTFPGTSRAEQIVIKHIQKI